MAGNTFITIPKNLKDEVAVRRFLEAMVKEMDRLRLEIKNLGGSG